MSASEVNETPTRTGDDQGGDREDDEHGKPIDEAFGDEEPGVYSFSDVGIEDSVEVGAAVRADDSGGDENDEA